MVDTKMGRLEVPPVVLENLGVILILLLKCTDSIPNALRHLIPALAYSSNGCTPGKVRFLAPHHDDSAEFVSHNLRSAV